MGTRNCGECLMTDVEVVELRPDGKCPRCGADYGPDTSTTAGPADTFASWAELISHVQAGRPIAYHAPLDSRPVRVRVKLFKNGKIRVYPPSTAASSFTADQGHLSRFRKVQA